MPLIFLNPLLLIICSLILPPLTVDERIALQESVRDDTELVESSALDILINHVAGWEESMVDCAALPTAPMALIVGDPAQFRGDPFCITGQLVRRDRRPMGRSDLEAWIIIPDDDMGWDGSIAVLIPTSSWADSKFGDLPKPVEVAVRFFARLAVESENDSLMVLPLFVGDFPVIADAGTGGGASSTISGGRVQLLIGLIVGVALVFAVLRIYLRRQWAWGRRLAGGSFYDDEDDDVEVNELPAEPAEALEVLRKSNEEQAKR